MNSQDPDRINRLVGRFLELQEQWADRPDGFDWHALTSLAAEGADAYNEGAGPSFHALALGGVACSEFHERFLQASIEAGFDPFKLTRTGNEAPEKPVIDHASLARDAAANPSAARMHDALQELARRRFEPMLRQDSASDPASPLFTVFQACAESIPRDLLARVAPDLAKPRPGRPQPVNAEEAYLSQAESIIDSRRPYG
ncbi:hypothetical protein SAMN06265795_103238 [Noviherbaspirillum humi]|uniref:Uncharacterized protein n=1 Tax=Noviherbaspirillum humi TaxID=1688639 RepID=A0A239FAL9_9BURK|nr:hypothetical protein [Noviherbaspirillum humi]SNS53202.1 hypothetical protein SAMN06265795_103238 [Noviherbaspirillum humi]